MIAEVVFNLSINKGLDYRVPAALSGKISIGSRVLAPLRKQTLPGYVIRLKDKSRFADLKSIVSLEDEKRQIPANLLRLAKWISDYYCCPIESAVWAMLPAVVRRGQMRHKQLQYITLTAKATSFDDEFEALSEKKQQLIKTLHKVGALPQKDLVNLLDFNDYTINNLCQEGWLNKEKRVVERDPFRDSIIQADEAKILSAEQKNALEKIVESLDKQDAETMLLHGVTGSGKTEVYLQAIDHCLKLDRQAIVLVPEISLTPQTCDRFRQRFGNLVSVLHSALSDGERYDEWNRINDGRSSIVVGARSAIFAPFRKLGLIIVDEEHETSYKQEDNPRYNARDIAVVRGKMEQATIVLGSATPSLETYHNCKTNRYSLLELNERIDSRPMPRVEIIDMVQERAMSGKASIFSERLVEQIRDRLYRGEQTMIFLNRRGFASQMQCTKCGFTATCENCSISYTYHKKDEKLLCHLCGVEMGAPLNCPSCADPEIRYTGFGTEKLETIIRKLFPKALTARMDSDSMTAKDSYRKVLDAFRKGHINILVGTQMISKGLDFPNVTLVGLIQADLALNQPDFRSGERCFQLITQMAGRAGRGDFPGLVLVQTCTPTHYALQSAQTHDFRGFYEAEMPGRDALCFPPFSRMIMIHLRSENEELLQKASEELGENLKPLLEETVQVIGPLPAPLSKINKFYRYQILLRGMNVRKIAAAVKQAIAIKKYSKVNVNIDVDPRSML